MTTAIAATASAARSPASGWKRNADRLLRDVFSIEHLRTGQADVIGNVMSKRDTLAITPTGAGKSLCYQLPALMMPGRTLVISPHYQMPGGLDAYYQESGRAGRDGGAARRTLLYLHSDKAVQRFFLAGRYPAFEDVEATYLKLLEHPVEGDRWTVDTLHRALDRPRSKVQVALVLLRRQRIVVRRKDGALALRRGDLDPQQVERLITVYREKREHDRAQLEQMVFYGQTGYCRWQVLLKHFDEAGEFERCSHCDNCRRMAAEEARRSFAESSIADSAATIGPEPPEASATPGFSKGDRVRVPRYGKGAVASADSQRVHVVFPSGDMRCFLASFVTREPGRIARPKTPRRGAADGTAHHGGTGPQPPTAGDDQVASPIRRTMSK